MINNHLLFTTLIGGGGISVGKITYCYKIKKENNPKNEIHVIVMNMYKTILNFILK